MSLKNNRLLKGPLPHSNSSAPSSGGSYYKEELARVQGDLLTLAHRIADAKGETIAPTPDSARSTSTSKDDSSPFVLGLRALADAERKMNSVALPPAADQREVSLVLHALQSMLEKVSELDRLVLSKTAPPEDGAGPKRRKSFGAELASLPTHLRLVDRLLDLYNQSQRVTVIRHHSSGEEGSGDVKVDKDKAVVDNLRANVNKLTEKLESSEKQRIASNTELEKLKKQLAELELKANGAAAAMKESQQLRRELDAEREKVNELTAESQRMREQNKASLQESTSMQKRLEEEIGINQIVLHALRSKAARVGDLDQRDMHCELPVGLPSEFRGAFESLDNSLQRRVEGLRQEIALMLSVKDMLEGELGSANLQRDMLQADFRTLSEEHEALKAAYHSLSYESATSNAGRDRDAGASKVAVIANLTETVEQQKETIAALERDLHRQSIQLKSFEQWPALFAELEAKVNALGEDKARLDSDCASAREEIKQYKKLTETLKQKLRDLGAKSNGSADFLDTFEEVMKEEMMTMKSAFEAKLKAARDHAEENTKKHQQEILRMQAASPHIALSRAATSLTALHHLPSK